MKQKLLRVIAPTVTLTALLTGASSANAQNINVTVDGDVVSFNGQQPVKQFGTVLVPLRGVFEKLGAHVEFDGASKSIRALKGSTTVMLRIGETAAQVNGQARTLSMPAQVVNGSTLVPLRFVSEALGADVKWIAPSQTVVIATTGRSSSAATPAPGGGTTAAAAAEVTSLSHNAGNAVRAGETVTVTLQGTPGGVASFSIPGIEAARNIALKETNPGTYVGSFAVPNGINVKGASVLASLKVGAASSPVIQAGQALTVDAVGPTLGSLTPTQNASLPPGKPLLYGTLSDAGTGINSSETRLIVNNKDVTAQATVTDAFFNYRPDADLPQGKNIVTVVAKDNAGNETRKDWSFTVSASEALIKDVTFTPDTKTLEPGDVMTVRMTAQAGGRARFSIGGAVTDRPMTEQNAGVYVGNYTVKKGDSLAQAPVSVAFTSSTGRTVTQTSGQSVTIAAGAPAKPTITGPTAGAAVGDTVTITGKAAPNATVRYSLKYQGVLLILPAGGTVADGEVKANEKGEWATPAIRLSTPAGISRLTYQFEAQAVGAAGEASESATVDFKR